MLGGIAEALSVWKRPRAEWAGDQSPRALEWRRSACYFMYVWWGNGLLGHALMLRLLLLTNAMTLFFVRIFKNQLEHIESSRLQ